MFGQSTISKKMMMAVGAILLATLAIGVFSLYTINSLSASMEAILSVQVTKLDLSHGIRASLYRAASDRRGYLLAVLVDQSAEARANKDSWDEAMDRIDEQVKALRPLLVTREGKEAIDVIEDSRLGLLQAREGYLAVAATKQVADANAYVDQKIRPRMEAAERAIERLVSLYSEQLASTRSETEMLAATSLWINILLVIGAGIAGAVAVWVVRGVNSSLQSIAADLGNGSEEVASAASQVSSSAQSMSQAANEQAASLEETSASSEELNSMTQKNAENSKEAAQGVDEAGRLIGETNQHLDSMLGSMKSINESSEKISKIIKVIDEIAFQTNILALNAAVEAARAGEAGMGFAVVADEVRNLAQRSAQAAKDTASLIEDSIGRSNEGGAKLDEVAKAIRRVSDNAERIKTLVNEVSLGSQEQARGIDQIAKAITQMERVTQQVASNAEESAAASEQLNAQAETVDSIVARLAAMVGGATGHKAKGSTKRRKLPPVVGRTRKAASDQRAAAASGSQLGKLGKALGTPKKIEPPKPVAAGNSFPMDDHFEEF